MNIFLTLAYLFFIGSLGGWVLELLFRRFFSKMNPNHKWINPGFCTGPYLPLYGSGLCVLYLLSAFGDAHEIGGPVASRVILFVSMAVSMTVIEYIAGIGCLKIANVRLWDYRNEWGNIQGLICPRFSLYWAICSAIYYFFIHPHILGALDWLSRNLAFSFVIGFFFGVFTLDVIYSAQLVRRMKAFAKENAVIIRYENLKEQIREDNERRARKAYFFFAFHTDRRIYEHLSALLENAGEAGERIWEHVESRAEKTREKAEQAKRKISGTKK